MMSKNAPIISKKTMCQHLVVKLGYSEQEASKVIDLLNDTMREALLKEGKVIWTNIGTLSLRVIPPKVVNSFGVPKKMPTRYKLKFEASRNFVVTKKPLDKLEAKTVVEALWDLAK